MNNYSNSLILFVGGGSETAPGVTLAKEMGLDVVVLDGDETCPCASIADYFIHSSTYDIKNSLERTSEFFLSQRAIHGVLCLGTDVPVTVSAIANQFGLPGLSEESAILVSDKLKMKDRLSNCNVNVPWYSLVENEEALIKIFDDLSVPLVVKPVDSRGSRGVTLLRERKGCKSAYYHAQTNSPTDRVMVEKFINGPQVSTEAIVVNGNCKTIGFSDRNYEFLDLFTPYIVENGGDLPSKLSVEKLCEVERIMSESAAALNIDNGILKGDIVISDCGDVKVIEVAGRLSGGYFCTHEIPLNTGVDFVGAAINQALGRSIDLESLTPTANKPVSQRYIFPETGIIDKIKIPSWINDDPDVVLFEMRISPGDKIEKITSHPSRGGVVICVGTSLENAIKKAETVVASIKIKMK